MNRRDRARIARLAAAKLLGDDYDRQGRCRRCLFDEFVDAMPDLHTYDFRLIACRDCGTMYLLTEAELRRNHVRVVAKRIEASDYRVPTAGE
jgi:hypothetical protein